MPKIILENRYTVHQKISFLLYLGGPIILLIAATLLHIKQEPTGAIYYVFLLVFTSVYAFLICVAFLKRGFIKIKNTLYRGSFFRGRLIFIKKINLYDRPKLAILKFKKAQKYAFFQVANPDMTSTFNSFEVNILNERHTKRDPILTLKNEENAEKLIDFLTANFPLEREVYSPDFR